MSLAEMMIPTLRVMQTRMKGKKKEVFVAERCEDLKGLDEKKGGSPKAKPQVQAKDDQSLWQDN